jgi:hypothetical protein
MNLHPDELTRRRFLIRCAEAPVVMSMLGGLAGLAAAPLAAAARQAVTGIDISSRDIFDQMDESINDGNGQKHQSNEEGVLEWQQSTIMFSYLLMYRAHRDIHYLDKAIDHIDHVLKQRDSELGEQDYRGESAPAWAARRYSVDRQRIIGPVGTGMIVLPIAEATRIIRATPALREQPKYRQAAERFLEAAEQAIAVHDFQWRDLDDGLGTYIFPKGSPMAADGIELPQNMNQSMGRPMIHLWRLTGNDRYRDRVMAMGRMFQQDLRVDEHDAYLWNYHWRQSRGYLGWTEEEGISANRAVFGGNRRMEDTSHGTIGVSFAAMMLRDGLMFDAQDMRRFANTFLHHVLDRDDDGRLVAWRFINGTGDRDGRWDTAAGQWAVLAPWNMEVFERVMELYRDNVGIPPTEARRASAMTVCAYMNVVAQEGDWDPDADLAPR